MAHATIDYSLPTPVPAPGNQNPFHANIVIANVRLSPPRSLRTAFKTAVRTSVLPVCSEPRLSEIVPYCSDPVLPKFGMIFSRFPAPEVKTLQFYSNLYAHAAYSSRINLVQGLSGVCSLAISATVPCTIPRCCEWKSNIKKCLGTTVDRGRIVARTRGACLLEKICPLALRKLGFHWKAASCSVDKVCAISFLHSLFCYSILRQQWLTKWFGISALSGTWNMPQEANLESLELRSGFVVCKLVKSL